MRAFILLWFSMLFVVGSADAEAQLRELPPGFQRVTGTHIDVITDMPLSDDIRDLPYVFDAAMPIWCAEFGVPLQEVADWRVEAFIMLDRERFRTAGFIPAELPNFPYGFQFGNQVWVSEQPSGYYRRHLLLHEGTHWFMARKFGGHGPPWLMEGMAEWLGTHRWDGQRLAMGIIPKDKEEVPYWGRITVIRKQLSEGTAPSLETILRYSDTAHQQVDAYAWSWAAVLFLRNHPDSSKMFQRLFQQPMRSDPTLTRWLFARLRERWPSLRQDWNVYLSELEYGYDQTRSMLRSSPPTPMLTNTPLEITIRADESWQAAGVSISAGTRLNILASGRFAVGQDPAPWTCEPDGVTLEYYRGEPLGKLMLAVIQPIEKEPPTSELLKVVPVGVGGDFTLPDAGQLFFKVNEASGGLTDNTGQLTIVISP